MIALEFTIGHLIYNLAYTYKFQLKTAQISWFDDLSCVSKSGVCHKTNKSLAKSFAVIMNDNHLHSAVQCVEMMKPFSFLFWKKLKMLVGFLFQKNNHALMGIQDKNSVE